MSHPNSAAWAADLPLLRLRLAGRALNTAGVAFLAIAIAIVACVALPAVARTGLGVGVALSMIAAGDFLCRRGSNRTWWFSTSVMAAGYALAAFFAQATFYLSAVEGFANAYPCWLLELALAMGAAYHASRNSALRWVAAPFTLALTANVLLHALASTETLLLFGQTVDVAAIASVIGVGFLAGLCALYQKLESGFTWNSQSLESKASWLLYRVSHEAYFVLAAINALALPKFCSSLEYAPLWWALEMPLLLAISWRSKSFVKHALVMGIWALSAVLLVTSKLDLSPLVRMAVPVSGLAMALTYRYISSSWALWQKRTGYALYLYGSLVLAVVLPILQLSPIEALPYWLVEAGLIVGLALALADRVLQRYGTLVALASLALFGSQWQSWDWPTVSMVLVGSYAMSLAYGYYKKNGGLKKAEFVPGFGEYVLTEKQAGWFEIGAAAAGYATGLFGSYLLLANPYNTMSWGAAAFALIAFGFLTRKVGHRASGLLLMAIASAKLTIFDLSGAGTLLRTLVSFGAVGVCCIAAGIFYLVEYGRHQKRDDNDQPPLSDNDSATGTTPDDRNEGGN